MIFRKSLHRSSEDLLRSWLYSVLRSSNSTYYLCYPTDVQRRYYSSHFIFIITTAQLPQPAMPSTLSPAELETLSTNAISAKATAYSMYRILHHSRHATLQIRKSANPPFDHYRVENTHTHTHDSRPLLQLPRWSVPPHFIRGVHHRRECRECLVSGDDLCREGSVWDCCGMSSQYYAIY